MTRICNSLGVQAKQSAQLQLLAAACRVMGFLVATVCPNHAIVADEFTKRILTAWEQRLASTKSFHYQCSLESIQIIDANADGDLSTIGAPPSKNPKLEPVVLRSELTFLMDGRKFASKNVGETWDEQKAARIATDFRACFDGKDDKWLLQGGTFPHGHVAIDGDMRNGHLSANVALIGLWLGYSPRTWLERKNFLIEKMSVRRFDAVDDDGTMCIELSLPRKGKQHALLYVDPSRQFVPVKLVQQLEGVTQVEHAISYRFHAGTLWGVSKWATSYFDKSGKLNNSHTGKTTSVSFNEKLDERLFQLEFPPGTQIVEKKAGDTKYYIQELEGRRREISPEQYGRLPEDMTTGDQPRRPIPLTLTTVIAFALLVAVGIKRMNRSL